MRKAFSHFFIALFIIFCCLPTFIWLSKDSLIPSGMDSGMMAGDAARHYVDSKDGALSYLNSAFFEGRHWRGSLLPIVASALLLVTNGDLFISFFILQAVWILVLATFVFRWARLFSNQNTALFLTFLAVNLPIVFWQSLIFMTEVPFAAFSMAALFFWSKDCLSHWRDHRNFCLFLAMAFLAIGFRILEGTALLGPFVLVSLFQKSYLEQRSLLKGFVTPILFFFVCLGGLIWLSRVPDDEQLRSIVFVLTLTGALLLLFRYFVKDKFSYSVTTCWTIWAITFFYSWGARPVFHWLYDSIFGENAGIYHLRTTLTDSLVNFFPAFGSLFFVHVLFCIIMLISVQRRQSISRPQKILGFIFFLTLILPVVGLISPNGETRYYISNILIGHLSLLLLVANVLRTTVGTSLNKAWQGLWVLIGLCLFVSNLLISFKGMRDPILFHNLLGSSYGSRTLLPSHPGAVNNILSQACRFFEKDRILILASGVYSEIHSGILDYGHLFHKSSNHLEDSLRWDSGQDIEQKISHMTGFLVADDWPVVGGRQFPHWTDVDQRIYSHLFGKCKKHPCPNPELEYLGTFTYQGYRLSPTVHAYRKSKSL